MALTQVVFSVVALIQHLKVDRALDNLYPPGERSDRHHLPQPVQRAMMQPSAFAAVRGGVVPVQGPVGGAARAGPSGAAAPASLPPAIDALDFGDSILSSDW